MAIKSLSQREWILLLAACLVVTGLGYVKFRYLRAKRTMDDLLKETEGLKTKLNQTKWADESGPDVPELKYQLSSLEKESEGAQARLEAAESRFVNHDSPEDLQELKVEISSLARSSGVRITKNVSFQPGGKEEFLSQYREGGYTGRPFQQITIESAYPGLRRFIQGLNKLPWRVTIVRFETEVAKNAGIPDTGSYLVSILILAL